MRCIGMKERMIVIGMVMMGTRADGNMPEKDHDHNADDDEFFDQCALKRLDGAFDQIAAVIRRDNFNPGRKGGFHLLQLCTDPLDDFEGILSKTHDDNAANNLSFAVEVGDPAPDIRIPG